VGRLRQLPARVAALPARVAALPKMAERFYQSAEWLAYRRAHRRWTAERQGGVWCAVCGAGGRLILDHKVERKDGGADFPAFDGAEWLCTSCHNAKTAKARGRRANGR
jgi:5-methylcytosine-specific restriction protein A